MGPGEQHVGRLPAPGSTTLAALLHLTDLHLCDAESPARQDYLDHHGNAGQAHSRQLGVVGSYRPQEILSVQVAASALRAAQRLDRVPVSGAALDAVLVTGDVTDNAQSNELDWYAALMSGTPVEPWSGHRSASTWVGAPDAGFWAPWAWHPEGPQDGVPGDTYTQLLGFPRVPGLISAARQAVTSPGVSAPLLTVHGNHDALLQGSVQATAELRELAVGSRRIVDLPPGETPLVLRTTTPGTGPARYFHRPTSPAVHVVPDARRAIVHRPGPHYWARDVGEVRVVALDTVNHHGGWQGSLDEAQLAWLDQELVESSGRYVVVTSHHPSWTLTNDYAPAGSPRRRLAGDVLDVLLRHSNVVVWIAGHVHAHTHRWHSAPGRPGGFWEVTTASMIDWPQQQRVLEVVREPHGTLALTSTVVDHDADPTWHQADPSDPARLASLSRVLAHNDLRRHLDGTRATVLSGRTTDRNAVWRMPDPFPRRPATLNRAASAERPVRLPAGAH